MMNTIVNENLISFKELEQKIYSYACELAREITRHVLETYDKELAQSRDRKAYRGKGKRVTTIKTVYGEVEYARTVYRTETEEGQTAHVFLPDQAMHMDKIGLIATNLAEKIALTVTESPYRVTADEIRSLLEEEKTEELSEYIRIYAKSVASPDAADKSSKKAMELYQYLNNNREGLLPYDKRGIKIPEAPKGMLCKGMGIRESRNCTVITLRMKHRRMRWSVKGADNLEKAL